MHVDLRRTKRATIHFINITSQTLAFLLYLNAMNNLIIKPLFYIARRGYDSEELEMINLIILIFGIEICEI